MKSVLSIGLSSPAEILEVPGPRLPVKESYRLLFEMRLIIRYAFKGGFNI